MNSKSNALKIDLHLMNSNLLTVLSCVHFSAFHFLISFEIYVRYHSISLQQIWIAYNKLLRDYKSLGNKICVQSEPCAFFTFFSLSLVVHLLSFYW